MRAGPQPGFPDRKGAAFRLPPHIFLYNRSADRQKRLRIEFGHAVVQQEIAVRIGIDAEDDVAVQRNDPVVHHFLDVGGICQIIENDDQDLVFRVRLPHGIDPPFREIKGCESRIDRIHIETGQLVIGVIAGVEEAEDAVDVVEDDVDVDVDAGATVLVDGI